MTSKEHHAKKEVVSKDCTYKHHVYSNECGWKEAHFTDAEGNDVERKFFRFKNSDEANGVMVRGNDSNGMSDVYHRVDMFAGIVCKSGGIHIFLFEVSVERKRNCSSYLQIERIRRAPDYPSR